MKDDLVAVTIPTGSPQLKTSKTELQGSRRSQILKMTDRFPSSDGIAYNDDPSKLVSSDLRKTTIWCFCHYQLLVS